MRPPTANRESEAGRDHPILAGAEKHTEVHVARV